MWNKTGLMSTPPSPIQTPSMTSPDAQDKPGFRTKTLGTRLSPDEMREVEAAARQDGKSASEWVRDAVLRSARPSPAAPTELLLEELTALRYIVLNLFDATAQAAESNKPLAPGSVQRVRDAAESRKRAAAQKLLAEFRAGRG